MRTAFFMYLLLLTGCMAIFSNSPVSAIPSTISITAYLEDSNQKPLEGNFDVQVRFYGSETTTTILQSIDAPDSTVTLGILTIPVTPNPDLLSLDSIWYDLAIDTGKNGIDASDYFKDRFKITAVPFALTGKPAKFFNTLGGFNSATKNGLRNDRLYIAPFMSPSSGVKFTKMVIPFEIPSTSKTSFGLYNEDFKLIYDSGTTITQTSLGLTADLKGYLEPSKIYYGALITDTDGGMLPSGIIPYGAPRGQILGVATEGKLPAMFDPQGLDGSEARAINITLIDDSPKESDTSQTLKAK